MGLINWLRARASGHTDSQISERYDRANARSTDYMQVVQWYVEEGTGNPLILQDYAALSQQRFRAGHVPKLLGYRSDIERKLGHAKHIGTKQNPWISAFLRPTDNTVFCAYVLLRDENQQYAIMKPYWFLSSGEKEADFRRPVPGAM
ncbi:MAG: hypothetical protein OHK0024_10880 [Thalassobaculales bacterium]